jgi:ketosteroid isomerase-like protein
MAAEEEGVRATSAQWLEFSQGGDAAGVASLFAEDGALFWEDRPPTAGPAAVEEFMRRQFAEAPAGGGDFGPDRIFLAASGDLAVEQGTFTEATDEGRYLTVYKKVGEDWKVAADMSLDATPHGGAPAWAQESLARWYETFNARDAEALADLYAVNARVGDAQGRSAIVQSFQDDWAESDATCSGGYDDFFVVGTIAAGRGRDVCTVNPADGGESTTVYSRWLALYEQQPDGTWLCIRDRGEPVGS